MEKRYASILGFSSLSLDQWLNHNLLNSVSYIPFPLCCPGCIKIISILSCLYWMHWLKNVKQESDIHCQLCFCYTYFQAIDRGENLTILADKSETLHSQVSWMRFDIFGGVCLTESFCIPGNMKVRMYIPVLVRRL